MSIDRSTKAVLDSRRASLAVARIQAQVLAVVFGTIGGLGMFLMTTWLLIKGGSRVGEHLQLLKHYFLGYSVSWPGSVIGLFWGALVGAIVGWSIARIYNWIVHIRKR